MLRLIPFAALAVASTLPAAESLTLSQAIARALADSPDARIAASRIDASEAMLMQARAAFQPQVKVQTGYILTNQPVNVFGMALNQRSFSPSLDFNNVPDADNWMSGASLTLPLYAGGKNIAGRDAALAALNASQHGATAVNQVLAYEVTRTFLMIHKTKALIEAAQASVQSFESNLQLSGKRIAAGTALKTDALDLELRLAQAREDLSRTQNANTLTRQSLAMLLGIESGEVDASPSLPPLEAPPSSQIINRPEILMAESIAQAAAARIRQASSGWKPSVNAFGSAEHNRGGQFDGQGTNYTVGVMANWDIWDGHLTRGRVNQAEAELTAAQENVRRQRLAVTLEVQQARSSLSESIERLDVSAKSVQLAEESVKLTRERFESGLALAAQLIDAETALTAARVRRAEAETDRRVAVAALRRALGMNMIPTSSK
jgi:outer membrane protein TolC